MLQLLFVSGSGVVSWSPSLVTITALAGLRKEKAFDSLRGFRMDIVSNYFKGF